MALVHLDTTVITDWPSFHAECQRALGFSDDGVPPAIALVPIDSAPSAPPT